MNHKYEKIQAHLKGKPPPKTFAMQLSECDLVQYGNKIETTMGIYLENLFGLNHLCRHTKTMQ